MLFRALTLVAVLALAVGTWLLSAPGRGTADRGAAELARLPGYYLKGAVLTEYDVAGNPGLRIEAERIDQIDHGNEVALHHVRVNYQAPGGELWVLIGDDAHILPGGTVIDVAGNVRLEASGEARRDTAVMHTDTLRYDTTRALATTASDVRIDYGASQLNARGMVADLKDRTIRLESRVNGRFQP